MFKGLPGPRGLPGGNGPPGRPGQKVRTNANRKLTEH